MVKCLRVKKELGESAKRFLLEKKYLALNYAIGKSAQRYLLLPLVENAPEEDILKNFEGKILERNLQELPIKSKNLKNLLIGIIPNEFIDKIIKSYDVVGDICILDIPEELEKFELTIAHTIKRNFPNIKVVAKKTGKRTEIERVQPLKIITGENRLITTYKEHGVLMKVDLEKVYFSPRASGERLRIAKLVKPFEKILVMFSGVCPYALVIAKFQPNCKIWAIDINPEAHKLALENVRLNRVGHIITPLLGDVKEIVPKIGELFDRIIMPFPEKAWDFLPLALKYAAPSATIHFIVFVEENKLEETINKIKEMVRASNRNLLSLSWRIFGSYAPKINRYVFDIKIE
ncbi:MAG: class I SAM-dependent methyltransferase family protein [Candidatus Nanoarchaeia archaeon]